MGMTVERENLKKWELKNSPNLMGINELQIAQMENIHMQASYSKAVENQWQREKSSKYEKNDLSHIWTPKRLTVGASS